MPEKLWIEVCSIVKEAVIKTITKKRKRKKAKWLSEEALQIAEKRKEAKRKGEKGRYTHVKAEFQRIARRDKKAFLSDQCKEIEENNRMGGASLIAQSVKNLPAKQESWLGFLSQEDPLEKEMATHSSILARRIPWTEVCDIVEETRIKTILKNNECKKQNGCLRRPYK